jgi:hypothetical protein
MALIVLDHSTGTDCMGESSLHQRLINYTLSSHVTSIFSESIWRIAHPLPLLSSGFSHTLVSFLNHQLYRTKALRGWTQDGALSLSFFRCFFLSSFKTIPLGSMPESYTG